MQFAAVDVETANADMASICQIGVAQFASGALIAEWKTYVDPNDHFDVVNVSIHGIDERAVAGAPAFCQVVDRLNELLADQIVVTHTHFDRVAVHQAATKWNVEVPVCRWLDSARVARRAWVEFAQSGYGLVSVCEKIGYKFKPHDALEDAKAAGNILLAAIQHTGLTPEEWLARVHQSIDPRKPNSPIARDGNPNGALYGEVLVFTGALQIPRREAAEMAARVGCEVDSSVTKRTTILIVGDQDIGRLVGHKKSSKHRKAEALILDSQHIRILREGDFRELIHLVG